MRPEVWDSERRSVDSRPGRASANVELAAHLAVEAAGIGAWDIAPTTREARWSARAKLLLGFSTEEQVTLEDANLRLDNRGSTQHRCNGEGSREIFHVAPVSGEARRRAVELAETTAGVEKVVDELAVPE